MKKAICTVFLIFGLAFIVFWCVMLIYFFKKEIAPSWVNIPLIANNCLFILELILGFFVIKVPIDQWFSNDDSDIMSEKDRILIIAVIGITAVCVGLYLIPSLYRNINAIRATERDNMKMKMLTDIVINTIASFVFYQDYQVLKQRQSS